MMSGQYQQTPAFPYTPGMEYSGEIVSLPSDTQHKCSIHGTPFEEGDKVFVDIFNAGTGLQVFHGVYQVCWDDCEI